MKKKLCLLLAALFLLTAAPPASGLEHQEDELPAEYDGFLVKIRDGDGIMYLHSSNNTSLTPVVAEELIYSAESILDIVPLIDAGIVEYMEPNYKVGLFSNPNDKYYSYQWNIPYIGVPYAWDANIGVDGVRIGVIDSGVMTTHEDFAEANISTGYNFISENTVVTDTLGHGTFIAGILTAVKNNSVGVAGIFDDVTIVPLKCFGSSEETDMSYIITGIYYAIEVCGCDVLNLSFGASSNSRFLREAVIYAEESGVIVIASVGNDGTRTVNYPAGYDTVVGVGSINERGMVSSFSQKNDSVFVTAPGEGIPSLSVTSDTSYSIGDGTSYSAPHVAAMAAIAKSLDPDITPAEFRRLLVDSATDAGAVGYDTNYGYGIIDIPNFLALLETSIYTPNTAPEITEEGIAPEAAVIYRENQSPMEIDMSSWFFDPDGDELTYSVLSASTSGIVSVKEDTLLYTPASQDRDKKIRIIVSAGDGRDVCETNAILTVQVESAEYPETEADQFSDLDGHWARKQIAYEIANGIFKGVTETAFEPDSPMSRAMFIEVLYRLSGDENTYEVTGFSDVTENDWYYNSAGWAVSCGITLGIDATHYGPDIEISREQMAVILYRFAQMNAHSDGEYSLDSIYGFSDIDSLSWSHSGVCWAIGNAIISGKTIDDIDPQGLATRAEAAVIILRYIRSFMEQ